MIDNKINANIYFCEFFPRYRTHMKSSYVNKCTKMCVYIYIYKENRYVDIIISEGSEIIPLSFSPLNLQMPRVQQ